MSFKKITLELAYQSGLRRCPCCDVQLVWKAHIPQVQINLATVDHIIPRSIGGADHTDNLFVMCRKCNNNRDVQCFVQFVTEKGVSKSYAEELYRKSHVISLQRIIHAQFTQQAQNKQEALKMNRKRRKQVVQIVKNYTDYFGDYLPEFELLQKLIW